MLNRYFQSMRIWGNGSPPKIRIKKQEDEPISSVTRQGNAPFPVSHILRNPLSDEERKKKSKAFKW